mmetsp:Transcript_7802/g.19805  ORF Transcript_7802/g.19805 Transcript_7802/m.19805 type:complete len:245 (+) Transcript_7802:734-1468(+)
MQQSWRRQKRWRRRSLWPSLSNPMIAVSRAAQPSRRQHQPHARLRVKRRRRNTVRTMNSTKRMSSRPRRTRLRRGTTRRIRRRRRRMRRRRERRTKRMRSRPHRIRRYRRGTPLPTLQPPRRQGIRRHLSGVPGAPRGRADPAASQHRHLVRARAVVPARGADLVRGACLAPEADRAPDPELVPGRPREAGGAALILVHGVLQGQARGRDGQTRRGVHRAQMARRGVLPRRVNRWTYPLRMQTS